MKLRDTVAQLEIPKRTVTFQLLGSSNREQICSQYMRGRSGSDEIQASLCSYCQLRNRNKMPLFETLLAVISITKGAHLFALETNSAGIN